MTWVVGWLGSRRARSKGLRIFEDLPWAPEDGWSRACEEIVPFG
jgi:hypothetical protein